MSQLKNKIMKQYRCIINYPSLFQEHKIGDIVYYNSLTKNYVKAEAPHYSVSAYDVENYPDCWELIEEEKPLFITEDGVEVSDKSKNVISVDAFFNKCTFPAQMFINENREHGQFKAFYHESNADEYILWNKPLFSLLEIDETIEMYTHELEELIKLAKERVGE